MSGPYHHEGGTILHATGRVIDPGEARLMVIDWAERAEIAHRWGLKTFAATYVRIALSLGEAWIAARDWRRAA